MCYKTLARSLVIKMERKDECTEMKNKTTAVYFASKGWVIERSWCFQKGGNESEKKKGKQKQADLRYFKGWDIPM